MVEPESWNSRIAFNISNFGPRDCHFAFLVECDIP